MSNLDGFGMCLLIMWIGDVLFYVCGQDVDVGCCQMSRSGGLRLLNVDVLRALFIKLKFFGMWDWYYMHFYLFCDPW